MKNVLTPLAKSVLISLGWTAAALATDTAIQKKMSGSGATSLIISNEEMNDVMKIVKSFEKSSLLMKSFSETIQWEHKGRFLNILLGAFGVGNQLTGKRVERSKLPLREAHIPRQGVMRAAEVTIRAGYDF